MSNFFEEWSTNDYQAHVDKLRGNRKKKISAGRSEKEHAEQVKLFNWAGDPATLENYPELAWLFAIPNGGHRHIKVAKYMKAEGQQAGVPDVFLPAPRKRWNGSQDHGLWVEMKAGKNKPTQKQRAWLDYLESVGYCTAVCWSFEDAKDVILAYLDRAL